MGADEDVGGFDVPVDDTTCVCVCEATEDLEDIVRSDTDTDVKEAALFGLSQLPDGAGFDALMKVAREGDDPELVQASLFWLGQTGDERAIALYEALGFEHEGHRQREYRMADGSYRGDRLLYRWCSQGE